MKDYPKPEQIRQGFDYRAVYPYWFFHEVTLSVAGVSLPAQYLISEIKSGYDYIVEGIAATWNAAAAGGDISPPPLLYILQGGTATEITEHQLQIDVITTPGGRNAAGQSGRYRGIVPVEHIFSYRDIMEFRIQAPAGGDPVQAQIVIFGRNIRHED